MLGCREAVMELKEKKDLMNFEDFLFLSSFFLLSVKNRVFL